MTYGYSRPLDENDRGLIKSAADDGTTTAAFAKEMNMSEGMIWDYLNSRNGEYYRERFVKNNEAEAARLAQSKSNQDTEK